MLQSDRTTLLPVFLSIFFFSAERISAIVIMFRPILFPVDSCATSFTYDTTIKPTSLCLPDNVHGLL